MSGATIAARDVDEDNMLTGPNVVVIHVGTGAAGSGMSYDLRHTVDGLPDFGESDFPKKLYYRVRVETESADTENLNRKMSAYTMGYLDLTGIDTADDASYEHDDSNPSQPMLDADVGSDGVVDNMSQANLLDQIEDNDDDSLTDDDEVPGEVILTVTRSEMGASDDYRVDISDDDGDTWTMVHSSTRPINQTEYEHQGLKPNTTRHFRIFTKKGSSYGVGSNVVGDVSAHSHQPDAVDDLTANAAGAGSITLTWKAPDGRRRRHDRQVLHHRGEHR